MNRILPGTNPDINASLWHGLCFVQANKAALIAAASCKRVPARISFMTLMSIPIIDLSGYRAGSAEGKQAVAKEVAQACRDIGFLVITGHGVPTTLVDRVDASAR